MKQVTLTTDGACLGNPGPGGWAALLCYGDSEKLLSGSEPNTTNNRMELSAVIFGLRALKHTCDVKIVTDSKYVMHAFTEGWLTNWQNNGWRTASRQPVKNQDLWEELVALTHKHHIHWEWVKGHAGHPDNERVDQAAQKAAQASAV